MEIHISQIDMDKPVDMEELMDTGSVRRPAPVLTATTVRGCPAFLAVDSTTIDDVSYPAIGIVIYEGGGVFTEVNTHRLPDTEAIEIAESMTPVGPDRFIEASEPVTSTPAE